MRPKKSLGQNFLKSKSVRDQIVAASDLSQTDRVLEIGPGKGILTEKLLSVAGEVFVVEKDDRLIPLLQEKFKTEITNRKLKIIHQDILEFQPELHRLGQHKYKIIANIPYYITGQILRKFLAGENQPSAMVLMIQKEVALRILARDGKESLLSLSVKAYGKPGKICRVSRKLFSPQPKVDSAVIKINRISKDFFVDFEESFFFEVIKKGFSHKRKKLLSNLADLFGEEKVKEIFTQLKIAQDTRAEDLPIEKWRSLVTLLSKAGTLL